MFSLRLLLPVSGKIGKQQWKAGCKVPFAEARCGKHHVERLQSLRSEIKDRDPDAVEVIVINPSARAARDIWESQFTIYVKAFECFPEPPDPNKPEWRKQVRIELADHQPHTGGTTR